MPDTVSSPFLSERSFGPASRQTRGLEATLRRTWLPVARNWRMTPRGIRMLQRMTEPGRRVPVLKGSAVEKTRVGGIPAEWVRGPRAQKEAIMPADEQAVVLYLHGGGYVFGSPRTHRNRQPHVVPIWTGTPEARDALREIGRFVDGALDANVAPAPPSLHDAAVAAADETTVSPPEAASPSGASV